MRNGLARVWAVVDHEAEAFREFQLSGDGCCDQKQVAEYGFVIGVGGRNADDMFLWHDQQVHGCLRLDVVENDAMLILVFDLGGNLTVDDFLK